MNTKPIRISESTDILLEEMKGKLTEHDRKSRDALINRAVKYWLYGDIDKGLRG